MLDGERLLRLVARADRRAFDALYRRACWSSADRCHDGRSVVAGLTGLHLHGPGAGQGLVAVGHAAGPVAAAGVLLVLGIGAVISRRQACSALRDHPLPSKGAPE